MNKMIALYRNEMTKVWRRSVLYIMALIMVLLVVGVSFALREADRTLNLGPVPKETILLELETERELYEEQVKAAEIQLNYLEESDPDNTAELDLYYIEYGQAKANLSKVDWIESHLDLYSEMGRISDILAPYTEMKAAQFTYERKPIASRTLEETASYTVMKTLLSSFETRFERGTFVDLLEMMQQIQKMAAPEDGATAAINERVFAYELNMAKNGESLTKVITLSVGYRSALEKQQALSISDLDKTDVFLPSERESIDNEVLIYEYRGETSGGDPIANAFANFYFYVLITFAAFIIGILVIIVAGSQISSERSSGSIKSLILSPVRRWKIVTAKLLACLSVLIIFIILSWIICTVCLQLILGQSLQPHLLVSKGHVQAMPGWLFGLATAGLQNIGSLFFMLFAFMLSSVGMSTAGAVGVSMGIRFGAQPLVLLLSQLLPDAVWMQFMPFQHLELQDHILPLNMNIAGINVGGMAGANGMGGASTTLVFSLIWIGALSLMMLVTTYDSFTKKDL